MNFVMSLKLLFLMSETIITCGGEHDNKMCWTYQPEKDEWRFKTNSTYAHSGMPGKNL